MSRERRTRSERSAEVIAEEMTRDFEEAKGEFYKAWYESELEHITPPERTARIKEVYRRHPTTAYELEELTDTIVNGEFISVAQVIIRQAQNDVAAERERARRVREEASHASAGQKRYIRRQKATEYGTNRIKPRDIH